jgi:23S rRNA pseudouridine1911/1915/1917 synthase
MQINIKISNDLNGKRLDRVICERAPDLSRSRAAGFIQDHRILVDNQYRKPSYRVKPGNLVTGNIPEERSCDRISAQKIDLDIVFEDEYIIVVNKKAGMVVHPGPGNTSDTLVNALLSHFPLIRATCNDVFRSGIVHRLDKDTSGLIVTAKTAHALEFLQKEFKYRRVEKKYLAIVSGSFSSSGGEIEMPIGRHPVKRKLMAVNHETGRYARTLWKVKEQFKDAALVEILLKTGRTHQIRVHFYAIGHPLMGDPVYQYRKNRGNHRIAPRQMLHSWQLGFRHPYSGHKMFFEADPPEDFRQVQAKLEQYGS